MHRNVFHCKNKERQARKFLYLSIYTCSPVTLQNYQIKSVFITSLHKALQYNVYYRGQCKPKQTSLAYLQEFGGAAVADLEWNAKSRFHISDYLRENRDCGDRRRMKRPDWALQLALSADVPFPYLSVAYLVEDFQ
ncbi:unnamed protein product [Ixodes persulcatus]